MTPCSSAASAVNGLKVDPLPQSAQTEFQLEAGSDGPRHYGPRIDAYLLHNAKGESAPFFVLPGLEVEISASQVREAVRSRFSASLPDPHPELSLLPHAVLDYIRKQGLYR